MKDVDPILEIRAWRDEFARLHGYDIARISAAMQETAARYKDRLIYIEPDVVLSNDPKPAVNRDELTTGRELGGA